MQCAAALRIDFHVITASQHYPFYSLSPPAIMKILCPIALSIDTFNYNLTHFLCDLLSLLVPSDYSCKDTFSFVSQIKNSSLSRKVLLSYDVTRLFTNIPLQESIDIGINLIFNHNPNLSITKKELKKTFPLPYITDSFYF